MSQCHRLSTLLILLGALPVAAAPADYMPRVEDYTHVWWAEGLPGCVPEAPWRRLILTGTYAMALDTDRIAIPHLGSVAAGLDYPAVAGRIDGDLWQKVPPADLRLGITVNGKAYRCTAGGKWTQFGGPRLIESGRFLQRADVTGLVFTAEDGSKLNVEARFETVAWPQRLALILAARPRERWDNASMDIALAGSLRTLRQHWEPAAGQAWEANAWQEVALAFNPSGMQVEQAAPGIAVEAREIPSGAARGVEHDPIRGWHRVDLDGIEPVVPPGEGRDRRNDAMERVKLVLANPTGREEIARLLFAKSTSGFRQRIGSSITGMSAVLRYPDGQPTGIPVQLSKNWHNRPEGGVYAGQWFHGFSQVRLPAGARVELELSIVYGHWGGVAAASHAQLCLVGWGSNQLWDESALGAWGESICYEPDQAQAEAGVLDVRPLMVRSMSKDQPWTWTHNVGGADFLRLFDSAGRRIPPAAMRTAYLRQGPCLTEVTYAGRTGPALEHSATVSLARTDDIVRGTYHLRLDVRRPVEFSRLVLFQVGADTYSYTGERKMAIGHAEGLVKEWSTEWGGNVNRTEPMQCAGRMPWISLHEAVPRREPNQQGAWANRGIVIRAWKARLGGKEAAPWMVEHGVKARGADTSTADIIPPPGVRRLEPGDFVDAVVEHLVIPQAADDYYGPSEALRAALKQSQDTWRMVHREAAGNDRRVQAKTGALEGLYPAITIRAAGDEAEFTLAGGLGYVPITFTALTAPRGHALFIDGQRVDQSVHGNDFWQADYDPGMQRWSLTYNAAAGDDRPRVVRLTGAQAGERMRSAASRQPPALAR